MSNERKTKHLWDCALALEGENHSKKLLKSYLINAARTVAGTNVSIPVERFFESQMCPHCSTHWQNNSFQIKSKSQGINNATGKGKKLTEKLQSQEKCKTRRVITKKQKQRVKWLLKRSISKVEIKCEFCRHKTQIVLNKPKKEETKLKTVVKTESKIASSIETRKKKKNKDKNAGLKILKPNNRTTVKENLLKEVKEIALPKIRLESAAIIKTPSTNLSSKSKTKILKSINKVMPPKIQSKTQKQNNLLQLAAMLKSQDDAKPKSCGKSVNRLESLLK